MARARPLTRQAALTLFPAAKNREALSRAELALAVFVEVWGRGRGEGKGREGSGAAARQFCEGNTLFGWGTRVMGAGHDAGDAAAACTQGMSTHLAPGAWAPNVSALAAEPPAMA
jgi:hypothetical protein